MDKKLLVVGCGMSQMPTLNAARTLKIETVGVDGSNKACAIYLANYFEKCDIKDLDGVLKIAKKYEVDGIVVPGTDFPDTGAYVSGQMGFPTISREVAQLCTDKYRQKKFLKEKGFLVPEIIMVKDMYDIDYGKILSFPIVIKPNDNMAARGSKKYYGPEHIGSWNTSREIEAAKKFSRSGTVIAEQFEEGPELSVDSLVYDGEVYVFAVADRHFALDPFFIEVGHTMPSILNQDLQREVVEVFTKAVKELGITHGSAKGDLKISDRGIMILEIAARISGGVLSGWTVPFATGYSPHEDLIRIHLGEQPEFPTLENKGFSAERNFLSIPGVLKEIQSFNMENHSCPFVHFHISPGDELHFPEHNAQRCGSAVSFGLTRNGAIDSARDTVKDTLFRLEPNNEKTDKFFSKHDDFYMYKTIKKENDWYGNDIEEALEKICVATERPAKDFISDENFWKHFYRGGIQGGIYYCDSFLYRRN